MFSSRVASAIETEDGRSTRMWRQSKNPKHHECALFSRNSLEWADKNPITRVRQSAKRRKSPDVLTPDEITAFLKELSSPFRTIEVDAFTGLRRGELIGLRFRLRAFVFERRSVGT